VGTLPKATLHAAGEAFAVELPKAAQLKAGGVYQIVAHGADALMLLRDGAAPQGYFAGDLASLGMAEVFGHLVSGVRSGQLVVSGQGLRKTVSLRDGQVVFATSSEPYERLGRSLVRRKLVTAGQLDAALDKVRPGVRLGQVLTQAKVVTASSLYSAMTDLVRDIVVGLFELTFGHFLFLEGAPAPDDSVKLPERTRDVVFAGLRRGEELVRLRRRLPEAFRVVAGAKAAGDWASLVAKAGAGAELAALRGGFDGGDFDFLSTIERLLAEGVLAVELKVAQVRAPQPLASPPSTLDLYGSLIRTICKALEGAGKDLSDLRSFFEDPLPGLEQAFAGVTLSDGGALDVERVRQNVKAKDDALARAMTYEALDAFVSYALFSAKNVLPADLAKVLGAEFKRIQEGSGA
jgi:hypothetical protein